MLGRKTTGSVVCPNCGRLVGVRDAKCYQCGRPYPGLFGFAPAVNAIARNLSFGQMVLFGCVALYIVGLAMNPKEALRSGSFLGMLSPGGAENFLLGMSGAGPIFGYGRWWTPLSAAWLHGGLIHIGFNMYWILQLAPATTQLLGTGRTIIIYTAGAVVGFLGTSVMDLMPMPSFLAGAQFTLGASASLCALMGGLYAYGRRSGQQAMQRWIGSFAIQILILGLLIPGIDNWGHIFGFIGGYVATERLRPLEDESPLHMLGGVVCLVLFAAAIAASVLHGLPIYRQ
ncbi:MAG: rhomboid family intramembrane serine protease [Acidobacteriota bacterium]